MGIKKEHYCDRCGKPFEYRFSKWAGYFKKGIRRKTTIAFTNLYYGNMDGYSYSESTYELCADCTEKLMHFLRHPDEKTECEKMKSMLESRFTRKELNSWLYQITFNGNIAIPEGGAVTPIAMALAVEGEPRATSTAIYTPAAVDEYGNITCTCIVTIPKGCCFSLSVRYVDATAADPTTTPTPSINLQNANLVINRIA